LDNQFPGLFGSYGIFVGDDHKFEVQVDFPGCAISSTADSVVDNRAYWNFGNLDLLGKDYKIELKSRKWEWINIIVTGIALFIILFVVFIPVRRAKQRS
jgi:hypothetical protein